jgi:glc operon protein GlcG
MSLTLDKALEMIHTIVKAAQAQGAPIAASIVDTGGRVIASARNESAGYVNLDVAQKKAATAVNFDASTQDVLDMVKGESLLLDAVMKEPELSLIPGGFPIRIDGVLVGGLGIAGARYSVDHAIGEQVLGTL